MRPPEIRDRSELQPASRKLELVAPEEIRRAIVIVVENSCDIGPDEIPGAVCKAFGFARSAYNMAATIVPVETPCCATEF